MEQKTKQIDLSLKDLDQFYGTEQYYKEQIFSTKYTDGVAYLMVNGYSWFVTDVLAVVEHKIKGEEFLAIKLLVFDDNTAKLVITDGNEKVLHEQKYDYTNAQKNLVLYCTNNVLMLAGEY